MPRCVRNFWVELDVDGRSSIAAGPRAKEGGFLINIKQRDIGLVTNAATITGTVLECGSLVLTITDKNGRIVHENLTVR